MGVYIKLALLPQNISPDDWLKTYAEVLFFLEGCPYELMSLKEDEIDGRKRTVFSRKLEHVADNPKDRHLYVLGDFQSRKTADSFIMYSNINKYGRDYPSDQETDILFSFIGKKGVTHVFKEKTQGFLFHIPMLAAAMIVEDRFPNSAYVYGDINFQQADKAQLMLKGILRRDVPCPICVDASRLFRRLLKLYQGPIALTHFKNLFMGKLIDAVEALYYLSDPNDFNQWFIGELKFFTKPTQLGAVDLLAAWLCATEDLRTLCHLACLDKNGPLFDPLQFASGLASTWISIDKSLRESDEMAIVDTVASQLKSEILDMSGFRGRKTRIFIEKDNVLNILKECFSKDTEIIAKTFLKQTEEIKNDLQLNKIRKETKKKPNEFFNDPETGDCASFLCLKFLSTDLLSPMQKKMLEWLAESIAKIRTKMLKETPELLEKSSESLRDTILQRSSQAGIILIEEAWNWLDREENLELLKMMVVLLYIENRSLSFCNLRNAILENRQLCLAVMKLSYEQII